MILFGSSPLFFVKIVIIGKYAPGFMRYYLWDCFHWVLLDSISVDVRSFFYRHVALLGLGVVVELPCYRHVAPLEQL
jgi:hypothetical protein